MSKKDTPKTWETQKIWNSSPEIQDKDQAHSLSLNTLTARKVYFR